MAHSNHSVFKDQKKHGAFHEDGFTGMGPRTFKHFNSVKNKMADFVNEQVPWDDEYNRYDEHRRPNRDPHHVDRVVGPAARPGVDGAKNTVKVKYPSLPNHTSKGARKHPTHHGTHKSNPKHHQT